MGSPAAVPRAGTGRGPPLYSGGMAVFKRVFPAVASVLGLALGGLAVSAADLQWGAYGALPAGAPAFSIAQDPAAPAVAWAATMGQGLQRTDDGKTWKPVGGGLPARLWRVAIDPSKGPEGQPPMYVGSAGQGLFKSLDNGKSWQGASQGLTTPGARNVRSVAMGVNVLVLGTSDGVYKSADGGKTWQAAGLSGLDISAVAFARFAGPPTIVAAIDGVNNPGSRVVISKDVGASWTPVKQGLPSDVVVSAIAVGPLPAGATQRPLFLAGSAGVFKSDDGGQGWGQLSGLPPQGYGSVVPSPADANVVYVASDGGGAGGGGIWRSVDRGGTWTALPGGIEEKGITALAVGRDNPATILAAAWNPDKAVAPVYQLSDTQAPPQGQPESGVCPEPSCLGNFQVTPSPSPSVSASPGASPSARPCTRATATPRVPSGSAASSSAAPGGGVSPAAATPTVEASPTAIQEPCPSPTPQASPRHTDIPVPLAVGVVLVLAGLLLGSLVVTRLRG
jgi:photosystem II stability/assembly factor-like uncharacterized protein